jgi:hypothetical protein
MDKLKLTGRNLGRVFNSELGPACMGPAFVHLTKQPNSRMKTRHKQLLGSLLLAFSTRLFDMGLISAEGQRTPGGLL